MSNWYKCPQKAFRYRKKHPQSKEKREINKNWVDQELNSSLERLSGNLPVLG